MTVPWLAAAYLLALLVPLLEGLGLPLARGSLAALAILPWLLVALVPRTSARRTAPAWREAVLPGLLALPPLGLAAGIDLARGAPPGKLALACAGAWAVLLLWSGAAECAARRVPARAGYAGLWLALLPGAAALRLALAWVPRGATTEENPFLLAALDPLLWCHGWGRAGGLGEFALGPLLVALFGAAFVLVCTLWLGLRSRGAG